MVEPAHRSAEERAHLREVLRAPAAPAARVTYAAWLDDRGDAERATVVRWTLDALATDAPVPMPAIDEHPVAWARIIGATLLREGVVRDELDLARRCLALARPALDLMWTEATDEPPVGATKLWGSPDLPATMPWPTRGTCTHWCDVALPPDLPCGFVGQLALAELADTQLGFELPGAGLLSLFAHTDATHFGTVSARVVLIDPVADLVRRIAPAADSDGLNGPEPAHAVILREVLSIPEPDGPWAELVGATNTQARMAYHHLQAAAGAGTCGLGGYFRTTSGAQDPTPDRTSRRLVVFPTAPVGSTVHFAVSADDLATGRLERTSMVWMDWD